MALATAWSYTLIVSLVLHRGNATAHSGVGSSAANEMLYLTAAARLLFGPCRQRRAGAALWCQAGPAARVRTMLRSAAFCSHRAAGAAQQQRPRAEQRHQRGVGSGPRRRRQRYRPEARPRQQPGACDMTSLSCCCVCAASTLHCSQCSKAVAQVWLRADICARTVFVVCAAI